MALSKKAKQQADLAARHLDSFLAAQSPRLRKADLTELKAALVTLQGLTK